MKRTQNNRISKLLTIPIIDQKFGKKAMATFLDDKHILVEVDNFYKDWFVRNLRSEELHK